MAGRLVYTKAGTDPATLVYPPYEAQPYHFALVSGASPNVIPALIDYGNGNYCTYADGRRFPLGTTPQGSTIVHVRAA